MWEILAHLFFQIEGIYDLFAVAQSLLLALGGCGKAIAKVHELEN